MFSDFAEVGDILWGPAAQSCLVTKTKHFRGALCVGCVGSSVVVGLTTMGVMLGGADISLVGSLVWPHAVAAIPLVWGSGTLFCWLHDLWTPGSDAGLLEGR